MEGPPDYHVVIKGDEECNKDGTKADSWLGNIPTLEQGGQQGNLGQLVKL